MDDAIDHQISLDPGGRNCRPLYTAARETGGGPLVDRAADRLIAAIEPGATVLVSTGFPITPVDTPETDGPLGAAVLGRAVARLGAVPVFVVDSSTQPIMTAVAAALGLEPSRIVTPTAAETLLARDTPRVLVAVETPGRTADGSYRNMAGEDITHLVDGVDDLFIEAADRDIPTVGVGDGGNEIGMGTVNSAVETHIDHGETVAAVTAVDDLVVSGVSNWGAYGIVAALSLSVGENLLHTPDQERAMLAACVEAGALDGVTGQSTLSVDGLPSPIHEHLVGLLNRLCEHSLSG
ncbi:MAG: DUF4392 domain-containing protein [Halohasta sp.]